MPGIPRSLCGLLAEPPAPILKRVATGVNADAPRTTSASLVLHPVLILGLGWGVPTRSVREDEAAIQGIPRSRFGLVSEPPTLILKLDAALVPHEVLIRQ